MAQDNFDDFLDSAMEDAAVCGKELVKGKNSRSVVVAYGYRFDSREELDMFEWIMEAKMLGFVDGFYYQPPSFELYEGMKSAKGKYLVRPHVYTADFKIDFNDRWMEFKRLNGLKVFDRVDERHVYVDVKGGWSKFDSGERSFHINMKWTLAKFGIYVWKIVPLKFFEKTWLPEKCVLTRKTHKVSAKYAKLSTFENRAFRLK